MITLYNKIYQKTFYETLKKRLFKTHNFSNHDINKFTLLQQCKQDAKKCSPIGIYR